MSCHHNLSPGHCTTSQLLSLLLLFVSLHSNQRDLLSTEVNYTLPLLQNLPRALRRTFQLSPWFTQPFHGLVSAYFSLHLYRSLPHSLYFRHTHWLFLFSPHTRLFPAAPALAVLARVLSSGMRSLTIPSKVSTQPLEALLHSLHSTYCIWYFLVYFFIVFPLENYFL